MGMLFLLPESPGFTPPAPQPLAVIAAAQPQLSTMGTGCRGASRVPCRAGRSGWRWGYTQPRGLGGPCQTEQGPDSRTQRGFLTGSAAPPSLQIGADGSTCMHPWVWGDGAHVAGG